MKWELEEESLAILRATNLVGRLACIQSSVVFHRDLAQSVTQLVGGYRRSLQIVLVTRTGRSVRLMRSVTRLVRLSVSLVVRATWLGHGGIVWLATSCVRRARLTYAWLVWRSRGLAVSRMVPRALVLKGPGLVAGSRLSLIRSRVLCRALVQGRGTLRLNLVCRVVTVLILEWWRLIVLVITMGRVLCVQTRRVQTVRGVTVSTAACGRLLWRVSSWAVSSRISGLTVRRRRNGLGADRTWCLGGSRVVWTRLAILGRERNWVRSIHLREKKSSKFWRTSLEFSMSQNLWSGKIVALTLACESPAWPYSCLLGVVGSEFWYMPGRGDCVRLWDMVFKPVTDDGVVDVTLDITEDVITELSEDGGVSTPLLDTWPMWLLSAELAAELQQEQKSDCQLWNVTLQAGRMVFSFFARKIGATPFKKILGNMHHKIQSLFNAACQRKGSFCWGRIWPDGGKWRWRQHDC